jgi:septal ring factor EnvC (AmiA/AmiB activator)
MFDAVLFLGGAVLFLLAVVFFVVLWQQRVEVEEREATLEQMETEIREQRVDLEILERELTVWEDGLAQEQRMLEEAKEELRMLTAVKRPDEDVGTVGISSSPFIVPHPVFESTEESQDRDEGRRYLSKNVRPRDEDKLG